jgi:heme oxygenase
LTKGEQGRTLIEIDFQLQMILQKLKESTRQQHEDVEGTVDVMSHMFSLEDYKRLIARFRAFYTAFEPTLPYAELQEAGFDYGERRKLHWLEADAKVLDLGEVEKFEDLPDVSSLPKAFGSLYVVEGSTLGGSVIARHLNQHLGLTPENGGSFYASYGARIGPMWKEFGEAITAYSGDGANDDEIVESAIKTFDSINTLFKNGADTNAAS